MAASAVGGTAVSTCWPSAVSAAAMAAVTSGQMVVPDPAVTGDQASSDEALSPPHQDDPLDDLMDVREASRLQQEIIKAWKQKKRTSCEMKTRTQDKYRQVYNSQQRFELEKEYHFQKYITSARKSELSSILHLSERQIKIWFQNRRAKERRQKKGSGHNHSHSHNHNSNSNSSNAVAPSAVSKPAASSSSTSKREASAAAAGGTPALTLSSFMQEPCGGSAAAASEGLKLELG